MMAFSLLDWIWDFFRKPAIVPIPTPQNLSGVELGQILKPYCSNLWLSDETYSTINKKALEEFLRVNPVSERKYYTDIHDCDNFSFELNGEVSLWSKGGTFGVVWGNRAIDDAPHAWNFFIDENKTLWYVEPQTDELFSPSHENIWIMII
jgi:hypothetical protein